MLAVLRGNLDTPKPLLRSIQDLWSRALEARVFLRSAQPWRGGEASAIRHQLNRLVAGKPQTGQQIYAERLEDTSLPLVSELAYLRHLVATDKTMHAIYATGLLESFGRKLQRQSFGPASAHALFALVADGPKIVAKVPPFEPLFLELVSVQFGLVYQWAPHQAADRCLRTATLLGACTVFAGFENLTAAIVADLELALSQTVLRDGAHQNRDGASLLKLLLLLMPLRQALCDAQQPVPQGLHGAIERMLPMVRMMRHGNGELAEFWADKSWAPVASEILEADLHTGQALEFAPDSQVARLEDALLVLAQGGEANFSLDVSFQQHRLVSVHIDSGRSLVPDAGLYENTKEGRMLRLAASSSPLSRDVFLSAGKADLRCEDHLPPEAFVQFKFAEGVTVLNVGADKIRFMTEDKTLWILAQRGGLLEQGTEYQNAVRLDPDDPTQVSQLNWALRRDPRQ